ncbi:MAG: hypothetical protein OXE99_03920 [Cellvibrionales bacterium]|nr:hypothetical protein [Cellvibrionales bacterium]
MAKYFKLFITYILGIVTGGAGFYFYLHESKEYLVTNQNLIGYEQAQLPSGTVLEVYSHMPEGFIVAKMHVAIEGEALKHLSSKNIERYNAISPIFYHNVGRRLSD